MKLIVGLGNIGSEYKNTNHNAGFMVLDRIAEEFDFTFKKRGCDSDYAEVNMGSEKFIIAKPRTYMNESGRAVKSLMVKFKIDIKDVLIINDDIDQDPGRIRIRLSGSAGSHNGLKSVVNETKSQDFARLRIGIGKQNMNQDLADFVLSRMKMSDAQKAGLDKATQAVSDFIQGESIAEIMAKYNGESEKNGKH